MLVDHSAGAPIRMTVMDVELTHMSTTGASVHVIQDTLVYIVPEIILM